MWGFGLLRIGHSYHKHAFAALEKAAPHLNTSLPDGKGKIILFNVAVLHCLFKMNRFQRLKEVKELKIFLFAQRANTRKQALSRQPLPCDALAPTVQNRAGARCPAADDTSALRTADTSAEDQQLYNRTSLTFWAHRGSLSKRRELVLSTLPTPPPFFRRFSTSVPKICVSHFLVFALHLHVSYVQSHHFPWLQPRALQSIRFLDSLQSEHIIQCHMCPWGRLLPGYNTRFFLKRGCCCQGKEVVPVDHIRGKGLSSRLTSGSKIRLTAGFEPCPQGPTPSSLAAAHSPF